MKVTVKDAIDQGSFEEGHHECSNDGGRIDSGRHHGHPIIKGKPREALHDEQSLSDERRMRARNHHVVMPGRVEHNRYINHVGRLESKIEFFNNGLRKHFNNRRKIHNLHEFNAPGKKWGDPHHDLEVVFHSPCDLWALHFDGHVFTGVQRGEVHLCNRCSRNRDPIKVSEHRFKWSTELCFDLRSDMVKRLGGNAIPEG